MPPYLRRGTFGTFPALLCKGLPAIEQSLFIWIWHHTNTDGTCFPSIRTLALEAGMGHRTVSDALRRLEHRGLIKSIPRMGENGQRSNIYEVLALADDDTPHAKDAGGRDAAVAGGDAADTCPPMQHLHTEPNPVEPNPNNTNPTARAREKGAFSGGEADFNPGW